MYDVTGLETNGEGWYDIYSNGLALGFVFGVKEVKETWRNEKDLLRYRSVFDSSGKSFLAHPRDGNKQNRYELLALP